MRLIVVETLGTGGMIHYAYQLCTALAGQGADVTLVTASDYELDDLPHNFTVEKRLRLWPIFDPASSRPPRNRLALAARQGYRAVRRGVRAVRLVREWVRLTNYLIREKPDLVQFGRIAFPFEGVFLARLRRRGLVLSQICHEFELRQMGEGPLVAWLNQSYAGVYDHFSAIFFHGESNRQRFKALFHVPEERLHVIPHGNENLFPASTNGSKVGVDLRQRYGLGPEDPVVLFFGTLTPSKGLPDLLQAFALMRRQGSRARLVVAGFPSKLVNVNELMQLATDLGISPAVTFDPRYIPIEEVGPLMKLANVVVYPYHNITQSGALQVAYAYGRPVVATAVGGLPEAVEDGRSGILVPPESPPALAAALSKILDDPELAAEMGAYARHLSKTRYSWPPIAGQILAVYRTLVASGERCAA